MGRRFWVGAVALGLLALAGAVAYFAWSLDARVERAIEESGTRLFGTRVTVDSVDLELSAGRGTIRGLRVANPDGFSDEDAIEIDAIDLSIEARSLREEPFRVQSVRIGESTVRFEIEEHGGSNLEQFARRVAKPSADSEAEAGGEPRRLAIDELSVAGGEIFFARPDAAPERVNLPSLEMSGIGGEAGATGGEIGQLVARAFLRRVVAATAGHQLGRAVEKELGGTAGDIAESVLRRILE
jgi:hypothetical protein